LAFRTCSLVVAVCFLVRSPAVALWIIDIAISADTAEAAIRLLVLFMALSPGLAKQNRFVCLGS
jgi:hypothetical protein